MYGSFTLYVRLIPNSSGQLAQLIVYIIVYINCLYYSTRADLYSRKILFTHSLLLIHS